MGGAPRSVDAPRESQPATRPHRFGKEMRLRKRREFLSVQQTGKKFHGRHFLVVLAPTAAPEGGDARGRVGITVTKKIGNAVTRNRIKRLVREYVRQNDWLVAGDTVIIAKRSAAQLEGYRVVAADLSRIQARIQAGPQSQIKAGVSSSAEAHREARSGVR